MKKNKGFTLIELLAVIVILAIIAIIAVPIILNVVEKSRESSAVDSAYGYINAIETNLATAEVKSGLVAENKEYSNLREFEETYNITVKGTKPESGSFTLEKRKVVSAEFMIDGYNIVCNKRKCESRGKNIEVVITYNLNGGTLDKTEDRVMTNSTLNLPTPTKSDYSFVGWFTEENGAGNEITDETPIVSDITLYAYYVQVFNYNYTGNVQTFTAPLTGKYKLEVWGAQGYNYSGPGGKGGYSYGTLQITSGSNLYVYVGAQNNGWNGGGAGDGGHYGGGATDISTYSTSYSDANHYYSRIIVAGGGGAGCYSSSEGGYGGGEKAGNAGNRVHSGWSWGGGADQIGAVDSGRTAGSFGAGGAGVDGGVDSGGGGGWYGGGVGDNNAGGGGSGWIYTESTYNYWATNSNEGKSGNWKLNSSYYLTDAATVAGNQTFKAPDGTDETGHTGNGYARITYLGK